jgi:two-component system NarL family response regulator
MIRVAVADDHEVVRYGLRLSLELEPDMVVVGEARTGEEAVRVAEETRPDVVLLDVRFGDDLDGPEVCRRILQVSAGTAVVMLTSYLEDGLILRSLLAGAKGYVIKDVELKELKRMIRAVREGARLPEPASAAEPSRADAPASGRAAAPDGALSETDLAVIRHLSVGLSNTEISARIRLTPDAVKDRVEKIGGALGVHSRIEVVAEALRRGLI